MPGGFESSVQFVSQFGQMQAALQSAVEQGMERAGAEGKQIAQSLARVDTGAMRESIDYEVSGSGAVVTLTLSVGTDHGLWNEAGTVRLPAQPMIRPAADAIGPRLGDYIRDALGAIR
jgi:HK97 gp10 family phage protein